MLIFADILRLIRPVRTRVADKAVPVYLHFENVVPRVTGVREGVRRLGELHEDCWTAALRYSRLAVVNCGSY